MGYAATAIVAWAVQGPYYTTAYIAKAIEVTLIVLLAVDFARMDGNPINVVKSELGAARVEARPAPGDRPGRRLTPAASAHGTRSPAGSGTAPDPPTPSHHGAARHEAPRRHPRPRRRRRGQRGLLDSAAAQPAPSGPVDPNGPTIVAKDMKFQTPRPSRSRPARTSPSTSTTRTRRRTTSRSTPTAAPATAISVGQIVTSVEGRPGRAGAPARDVLLPLRRPPRHDGDDHRQVGAPAAPAPRRPRTGRSGVVGFAADR